MRYNFTPLFFVPLFVFAQMKLNAQAVDKADSAALVDLYNSTKGDAWTNHDNWLSQSPVCTWKGITVSSNRVVGIDLGVNNLNGKLPSSLSNLAALQYLYLYNNKLTGAIPSLISNLVNMKEFLAGTNSLTGSFPSSLGKLKNLQQLDLSNNRLSGAIPFAIGSLAKAQYINLNNNRLSGSIPVTIGNLASVRILEMAGNQLSGAIPGTIGNLGSVQYLYLQNNKLSGAVPASIGNLQSLQVLYLDNNSLSGSLTNTIGNATNLQLLSITNNRLTGSIPSSIGNLSSLFQLYLNNNELRGVVPSSFMKLTNLQYLYLDHNHLSQGTNKNPVLPLNVFLHADISHNDFTFDGMEFVATHYPFVTYSPQASLSIHNNGESISLYAGGTLSNNSYTWYKVEDKSSMAIKGDSSFSPTAGGHYYAQIRNAVATRLVLYTDTFEYVMPSQTSKTATSIARVQGSRKFSIYPNPARNIVYITTEETSVITVTDADGKRLFSKTVSGNEVMDISRLTPGTYYIHNHATSETQKLIVVQ